MGAAAPLLIGQAASVLLDNVPKLLDLWADLAKRRGGKEEVDLAREKLDELRSSLSAIGEGLDAYIQTNQDLNGIEADCKTLRDFLDENPSLPAGSGKWSTAGYLVKSIQDRARYYETIVRNPQGLLEQSDLQRVSYPIGDFRSALDRAWIYVRQKQPAELMGETGVMVQKAGQISQVFWERIDTTLLALKKI